MNIEKRLNIRIEEGKIFLNVPKTEHFDLNTWLKIFEKKVLR